MEFTDDMKNRLKRIEGQARGVLRMMDEGKDCKDVISQLSAIRSAVDRATALIVSKNLENCVREQILKGENTNTVVKQAVELLIKSR